MDSPAGERFHTTRWTLIRDASAGSESDEAAQALAEFCRNYRAPLLAFARATVSQKQDAEDLIQSFFEKILERNFLAKADPERGKLRTFLLTCLKRHITDTHRRELAAKRGGGIAPVPLDEARFVASEAPGPDEVFHRQWALLILDRAVANLETAWTDRGKALLFQSLKPYLGFRQDEETGRDALADSLGLSKGTLKTTIYRLRKEYRECLLQEVAGTLEVKTPDEVMDELRELLACV